MLGRRKPRSRSDTVLAFLWPRRGLGRAGRYLVKRLVRLRGSPHAIAAGVASGAAVSFLPLPGLHFILGGVLALAARGSVIAMAVGTAVGNPWTFPFIWLGGYRIGDWLGFASAGDAGEIGLGRRLHAVMADVWSGDFSAAAAESWPVIAPMLIGGVIMGTAVWVALYALARLAVAAYQNRRRARLAAGRERWRRAVTTAGAKAPEGDLA